MSRGLSKQQQAIIETLRRYNDWTFSSNMAYDQHLQKTGRDFEPPTNSEIQSSLRAIRLLEKKGIVESKIERGGYLQRFNTGRGGASHIKKIRLSVDFKAKMNCAKHLEGARP